MKIKKKEFKLYQKVRDHCHYTGKFRGAAHSICNLRYKIPKKNPIVIHNGSTYEYHFIIKQLAENFKGQFENTEKCVYPYEYLNSWEKFDETSLPDKKVFYSKLNLEDITDKDYEHAKKVWESFEIKSLGEYHDLYVQRDTLLLADVSENFRDKWIEIYELDPAHFLSALGVVWQACLKKTKVKLELLTDIDMLLMVEKGIRGGICQAIHRHAKANNKYMKNYNKDIISSYLMYLDANNLYGWAMSQKLPINGFKWVGKSKLSRFNEIFIEKYYGSSDIGYFLEVYVDCPNELFNLHKDLPFLPERKKLINAYL